MAEFYHKYNEDGPDEFRIKVDGEDRLATIEDKQKYPEEYKAEKMKRAGEPPRDPWEVRKLSPGEARPEGDATLRIDKPKK